MRSTTTPAASQAPSHPLTQAIAIVQAAAITLAAACFIPGASAAAVAQADPPSVGPAAGESSTPTVAGQASAADQSLADGDITVTIDVPNGFLSLDRRGSSPFLEWHGAVPLTASCHPMPSLRQVLIQGRSEDVEETIKQLRSALATHEAVAADARAAEQAFGEKREAEAIHRDRLLRLARDGERLQIDWQGGLFKQFAEMVSRKWADSHEVPLNILFATPDLGEVTVPGFRVDGVSPATLLTSAATLASGADSGRTLSVRQVDGDTPATESVFLISVSISKEQPRNTAPTSLVKVFRLEDFGIEPTRVPAILEALSIAFEMQGNSDSVSVRFHEGTGLLFVRIPGDHNSQFTLDEVMGQVLR